MKIGTNSGFLMKCGMSFIDMVRFVKECGANSFELSFRYSEELLNFELTYEIVELLSSFNYLSIHAPFDPVENPRYRNDEFGQKIVLKLKDLVDRLPIEGIVFHPNNIDDFDFLAGIGLPILIENMDIRKNGFKNLDDISKLKDKYDFGFVLDVEHAFENDPSMELTRDLIGVMGDRLEEVHISGAKSDKPMSVGKNNHCLLSESEYRDKLLGILREVGDVSIILEGMAKEDSREVLKSELNYISEALE